jgi:hypothetical protein
MRGDAVFDVVAGREWAERIYALFEPLRAEVDVERGVADMFRSEARAARGQAVYQDEWLRAVSP